MYPRSLSQASWRVISIADGLPDFASATADDESGSPISDGLDDSRSEDATVLATTRGVLSAGSGSESPRISQAIAETTRTPAKVVYAIGRFFDKLLLPLESVAQSTRTIPKDWSDKDGGVVRAATQASMGM